MSDPNMTRLVTLARETEFARVLSIIVDEQVRLAQARNATPDAVERALLNYQFHIVTSVRQLVEGAK